MKSKKSVQRGKSLRVQRTKSRTKSPPKPKSAPQLARKSNRRQGRVPTSINFFDTLIEGGFEKNSTNILAGPSGAGKSIFATHFLMGGLEKGEACLYVTFEENKDSFYKNMADFGFDLKRYEEKGQFIFLEYTPIKVKTMLEEGGGTIESVILEKSVSRIVIDSLTSFELLFDNELEKREAALSLFSMIKKWNCTSLLTLDEDVSNKGMLSARTLEFESDSIIALYYMRVGVQRKRYLEIIKMRGTSHSRNVFEFDISGNGIILNKRPLSQLPQSG